MSWTLYIFSFLQDEPADSAGGFLADADKVVAAFHLPKNKYVKSPTQPHKGVVQVLGTDESERDSREEPELRTYDLDEETMDIDTEDDFSHSPNGNGKDFVPKTMQQMAEDAAKNEAQQKEEESQNVIKPEGKRSIVGLHDAHEGLAPSNSGSDGRVTRSRSGAVKTQATLSLRPEASEKLARGRRSFPGRRRVTSTNKVFKKRKRAVEDDSEPEDDAEMSNDEEDVNFVGDDVGDDDDEPDDGEVEKSTRGKRTHTGKTGNRRPKRATTTSTVRRGKPSSTPIKATPRTLRSGKEKGH